MFDIDFSPPWRGTCNCCGFPMTRLDRCVSLFGRTVAFYHAEFTEHPGHPPEVMIDLTLVHSKREPGTEERFRFPITLHFDHDQDSFELQLHEAKTWQWRDIGFEDVLGELIDQEAAVVHPCIEQVYVLMMVVAEMDMLIRQYLLGPVAAVEVQAEAQA